MGWERWIRMVEVAPAIEASEAAAFGRQVDALLRTGCRIFHINGEGRAAVDAVALLAPQVHRYEGVIDVHVPDGPFAELAAAGADSITFDAGAVDDVAATIEAVRATGVQAGVACDDVGEVSRIAGADLVLCTSTVEQVRKLAGVLPKTVVLAAEGQVSPESLRSLYLAGARVLIADEPIFIREDLPRAYRRLVAALA